jgi:sugar-phosphatase
LAKQSVTKIQYSIDFLHASQNHLPYLCALKHTCMLNSVIFDMDGLLIDSEPYWQKAGISVLSDFGVNISVEQYYSSTGLRTREWLEFWLTNFNISVEGAEKAVTKIEDRAIELIRESAVAFPGTDHVLNFFKERDFKIGLATSSPLRLVDVVVEKLGITHFFDAFSSAEFLPQGKPHPQVYLNCAEALDVSPLQCVCFEDSFHGFIAAKAARMKCVVVPEESLINQPRWHAADLKLASLAEFDAEMLGQL